MPNVTKVDRWEKYKAATEMAKWNGDGIPNTTLHLTVPAETLHGLTLFQALPNTYSHYRPILGDGNCGWRGEQDLLYTRHQGLARYHQ